MRILLVLVCFGVVSCGVKPSNVDLPEGSENTTFPRTYPDLSTDPEQE